MAADLLELTDNFSVRDSCRLVEVLCNCVSFAVSGIVTASSTAITDGFALSVCRVPLDLVELETDGPNERGLGRLGAYSLFFVIGKKFPGEARIDGSL